VYSCDNVGDELLTAIRADRGVEMVEYNLEWLGVPTLIIHDNLPPDAPRHAEMLEVDT
jgi:hypothetical protein